MTRNSGVAFEKQQTFPPLSFSVYTLLITSLYTGEPPRLVYILPIISSRYVMIVSSHPYKSSHTCPSNCSTNLFDIGFYLQKDVGSLY